VGFIHRALASWAEHIGEDSNRWNGRTQSMASRSPEQLHRELHLQVEALNFADGTERPSVAVSPEVSTHEKAMAGSDRSEAADWSED
jgi:hypothetical protein